MPGLLSITCSRVSITVDDADSQASMSCIQSNMSCIRVRRRDVILSVIVLALIIIGIGTLKTNVDVPLRESLFNRASIIRLSATNIDVKPDTRTSNVDRQIEQQETLQRRLPKCLIIGEMKCGTRALLQYMGLHPDIAIAKHETNFFDAYYNKGLDWYRRQMPLSTPSQITVEKTPSYYRTPASLQRIRSMNASMKVILLVRDPIDRSVSDWLEICRQLRDGRIKIPQRICQTFEGSGILTRTGAVNPNSEFISHSIYSRFINHWTRWFAIGTQLLVIDGDQFVSDPLSELVRVENFLGLRKYLTKQNVVFNEEKGFHCMVSDSGHKKCLSKTKGAPHPDLQPGVEEKLRNYFKKYNERFYEAVQRDFGWS